MEGFTFMSAKRTLRLLFFSFVLTFVVMRTFVILIMTRRIPDLYIHMKGAHVHHLNFGIFILAAVGALLLFHRPEGRLRPLIVLAYGCGLALTFDEFGMWLFLSDDYWGRASFDAVVIIAGILALSIAAPLVHEFLPRHWIAVIALVLALVVFAFVLKDSFHYAHTTILPRLRQLGSSAPQ